MSSLSLSFPGYFESDVFQRPERGSRVYLLSEEEYLDALLDPTIILDAAYDLSPDHPVYLRKFGPCSPLPAAEQSTRLQSLEFLFRGHGYMPVTDSYTWGVRRATVISSRLRVKLPKLFESHPDFSPEQLIALILDTLLDLGLPASITQTYQDITFTDPELASQDFLRILSGSPFEFQQPRPPLVPNGSLRSIIGSDSLRFYANDSDSY